MSSFTNKPMDCISYLMWGSFYKENGWVFSPSKWTLNDSHVSLYLPLSASYRLKFRVGEAERKSLREGWKKREEWRKERFRYVRKGARCLFSFCLFSFLSLSSVSFLLPPSLITSCIFPRISLLPLSLSSRPSTFFPFLFTFFFISAYIFPFFFSPLPPFPSFPGQIIRALWLSLAVIAVLVSDSTSSHS